MVWGPQGHMHLQDLGRRLGTPQALDPSQSYSDLIGLICPWMGVWCVDTTPRAQPATP